MRRYSRARPSCGRAPPNHDLVVLATPNHAHAPLAAQAIDRGLPVVVDKRLALTSGEAEALAGRSQRASTLLTVFQNRRWDSDQLTLARLLAEDRLGTVLRYESRLERWRPSANAASWRDSTSPDGGGGQLLDLGTHLVDQALVLFGPVTKAGFVVQELDGQEDALRSGARPDEVAEWGAEPESLWGRLVSGEESVPVPSERGDWPRFYALLVGALRDGDPPPVDPCDAVATLRILEAARKSAVSGQVVTLSA